MSYFSGSKPSIYIPDSVDELTSSTIGAGVCRQTSRGSFRSILSRARS
jgi:hypothetical protein